MEWDDADIPDKSKEIAIGWAELGDLSKLPASRDAFKAVYSKTYPNDKPGAIPVRAGVLYRFAKEIKVGDVVVYPSKSDRLVNIGYIASEYEFQPIKSARFPNRRKVDWKTHVPRVQFSQAASAIPSFFR